MHAGAAKLFQDMCRAATSSEVVRLMNLACSEMTPTKAATFVACVESIPYNEQMLLFHHDNTLGKTASQGAEVIVTFFCCGCPFQCMPLLRVCWCW